MEVDISFYLTQKNIRLFLELTTLKKPAYFVSFAFLVKGIAFNQSCGAFKTTAN